jgi:hypothetical protein
MSEFVGKLEAQKVLRWLMQLRAAVWFANSHPRSKISVVQSWEKEIPDEFGKPRC